MAICVFFFFFFLISGPSIVLVSKNSTLKVQAFVKVRKTKLPLTGFEAGEKMVLFLDEDHLSQQK